MRLGCSEEQPGCLGQDLVGVPLYAVARDLCSPAIRGRALLAADECSQAAEDGLARGDLTVQERGGALYSCDLRAALQPVNRSGAWLLRLASETSSPPRQLRREVATLLGSCSGSGGRKGVFSAMMLALCVSRGL